MARLALLGIATAVGLCLAACGDSGDSKQSPDSKQSFTAEANRVCAQGQRKVVDRYLQRGIPSTPQAEYEFHRVLLRAREELLAGLQRLDPPADQRKAYRRYLSLRRTALELTKGLVVADRKGDAKAVRALEAKIERVLRQAVKAAGPTGLDVCARKLSPGDAKAVKAVISEFEPSADPKRACRDLVTTQFLISRFPGGYAQCAAFVKKNAGTYAESVDVSRVEGTNGVEAVVEYKDVGGAAGGVPASATLHYVDGQWKIFAAQEESGG